MNKLNTGSSLCEEPLFTLKDADIEAGNRLLIENCSLTLHPNDRFALMGSSGIGKTTLLRVIAGILPPASGKFSRNGSVSMVFDQDGLYPDLSARTNIELGIPWTQSNKTTRQQLAAKWGEFFGCDDFLDQKVSTLSAGQRKRVGLARALMKEPKILLLDETFHALDPSLRLQLQKKVLELQGRAGFALVMATHDIREAQGLQADLLELVEDEQTGISHLIVQKDATKTA